MCYQITTMTLARHVSAVRFTSDGSRVSLGIAKFILMTFGVRYLVNIEM